MHVRVRSRARRGTNFLSGLSSAPNWPSTITSESCLPKESTGRVNLMKNSRSRDDRTPVRAAPPRRRCWRKKQRRVKKKRKGRKKKKKSKGTCGINDGVPPPCLRVVYIPLPLCFFLCEPSAGIPPKAQRIGRQRELSRITLKQCKQPV